MPMCSQGGNKVGLYRLLTTGTFRGEELEKVLAAVNLSVLEIGSYGFDWEGRKLTFSWKPVSPSSRPHLEQLKHCRW